MQIAYTKEQEELRAELQEYFGKLMTPEVQANLFAGRGGEYGGSDAYRSIVEQMGKDVWLGIGWPTEYGGQARSMMEQLIFTDEASIHGAPVPFLTINSVGPTIQQYGTEDQKQKFLRPILEGKLHFSIGYSEPGAGTDLASLTTRAVRDGDEYVINGQKMWTSLIEYADYIWLAVRTDPDVPKHKGLSILLVPTDVPGFKWNRVNTVGGVGTSATFYEDVRVPVENVVLGENQGWKLITNQLNHERVALCSAAGIQQSLHETRYWAQNTKLADGRRVIDQEWVQVNLARVHAKLEVLRLMNWKVAWSETAGMLNPADASATKVYGTELYTEAYQLLLEILGPAGSFKRGSEAAALQGSLERAYQGTLILTFGGGTNEVQRDLIAIFGLSMPRSIST